MLHLYLAECRPGAVTQSALNWVSSARPLRVSDRAETVTGPEQSTATGRCIHKDGLKSDDQPAGTNPRLYKGSSVITPSVEQAVSAERLCQRHLHRL